MDWWFSARLVAGARGYHRHGPADPADAPVYVAMGLMLVGTCVGVITGFIIAVVYGVRLGRRRKTH